MRTITTDNHLLSVSEVAQRLDISRTHVLRKIDSGVIPATKVGKAYVIKEADLPGVHQPLSEIAKKKIHMAVDATLNEYGDVIRKLGRM